MNATRQDIFIGMGIIGAVIIVAIVADNLSQGAEGAVSSVVGGGAVAAGALILLPPPFDLIGAAVGAGYILLKS